MAQSKVMTPDEEKRWREDQDAIWAEVERIVAIHPELEPSDVYHTIVQLRRTPLERLAQSLAFAKLRGWTDHVR